MQPRVEPDPSRVPQSKKDWRRLSRGRLIYNYHYYYSRRCAPVAQLTHAALLIRQSKLKPPSPTRPGRQ